MRFGKASMYAVGALLTVAAAASAQDTTRTRRATSQRRIPVTKEAPGEVVPARVDTVTIYRTDTLRTYRTDTLRLTNTVTRYDTVRMEVMPMPMKKVGGLYFGLAGGANFPGANFNDANHGGWHLEVPFGIDPINSPLGIRFNAGYSQFEPHSFLNGIVDNAQLMNVDGGLKLRIGHLSVFSRRAEIYGLASGVYNRYKDLVEVGNNGSLTLNGVAVTSTSASTASHNWTDKFGYSVGGGASVGWGNGNLFVETRYSRFDGDTRPLSYVPVVLGFTWF